MKIDTDKIYNNYAVYRYRSKIDGKTYIGMTGNLKQRIAHHSNPNHWRTGKEKWKVLYMMFSMYGYDNYEFTVLHDNLTKEEAEYWEAKVSPLKLTYKPTGQQILFRSCNNKDDYRKIKSTKFKKGFCKYLWLEELDEFFGMEEIRSIIQSLLRGRKWL